MAASASSTARRCPADSRSPTLCRVTPEPRAPRRAGGRARGRRRWPPTASGCATRMSGSTSRQRAPSSTSPASPGAQIAREAAVARRELQRLAGRGVGVAVGGRLAQAARRCRCPRRRAAAAARWSRAARSRRAAPAPGRPGRRPRARPASSANGSATAGCEQLVDAVEGGAQAASRSVVVGSLVRRRRRRRRRR